MRIQRRAGAGGRSRTVMGRSRTVMGRSRTAPTARVLGAAVISGLVLIVYGTWPIAAGADLFDDLYRRGQKLNGDLRTFTATFTESTSSPLLVRPLMARGTVAVERPFRVALRYIEPEERLVLIDGDRMIVTWPSRQIREVKDIGASRRRIQKYFVDGSPDDLRSHFTISAKEVDDGAGAYLVTMTPRRKQIQEGLARLDLWVDRETLLLSSMRMTFPNGQEKLMTFTDVKPNVPIDPATFRDKAGTTAAR